MPINRDYVDPAEITRQVRVALAEQDINGPNTLAPYLPSETIDDIEYSADEGQGGLIEAAMYRAFDAELPLANDEALGQMRGRIHPLGQKIPLMEEDRIRLRNGAESGLTNYIDRVARRIARAVALQINLKRAEALALGKLVFVGNDQNFEVPFGRRADFTTTAAELFTDPDSDPIQYLSDLNELYLDENGFEIGEFLTSTQVKSAFYRHPKVVNAAMGRDAATYGQLAPDANVAALLAQHNLPGFTVKGGRVKVREVDGSRTIKDLLPRDSIIALPAGGDPAVAGSSELGSTYWGKTIEADKPAWGLSEEDGPGIIAAVHDNDDVPARMWVSAHAIAMPVLINPNYSLCAKVI
ncbi:main capsid protein [Gordonia phage GTE5]|uniref:Main capsid protein n=2 Tax=Gruunavirus TaxID=2948731 RepID=Q2TLU9_9CAUD|nr:main capsid protein [Gordonia phage GTE5]YP_010093840.1 major capsid protein [Gordonia phage Flapper]AAY16494.1 putative main capsid protein [Gordonia phage GTE5]AET09769.1 main capsid protein [Gordonia phage GTE5]AVD99777.1 major capsid protein [Gordonia phage Flapper]